jgi:hypothetical protein
MLEHDIMTLGFYFAGRDEFGQVAKFSMVCEAVAHMRLLESPVNAKRNIDYWIDVIMEELHQYRLTPPEYIRYGSGELVHSLKTWGAIRELHQKKQLDTQQAAYFKQALTNLVTLFVMFDGNITDKEMIALRHFEESLTEELQNKWRASSVSLSYMDDEMNFHIMMMDNKEAVNL